MSGIYPDTRIPGRHHLKFPVSKKNYLLKWLDITPDLSKNGVVRIIRPNVGRSSFILKSGRG